MTDTTTGKNGIDWGAAVWAGLVAGVVFVMLEMLLIGTVAGQSIWGPPRMMAAIGMGTDVLPGPDNPPTFDAMIVLVGMIIHFVLSVVLGIVLAAIVSTLGVGTGAAVGIGAVFGLAVYVVNFYGFTAIFPWFENARNWITIVSHIMFGVVLASVYKTRAG